MANKMKNQEKDHYDQTAHNVACRAGCVKDFAKEVIGWIVNEIRAALVVAYNEAHVAQWFKEGEMVKAMDFPTDNKMSDRKGLYDLAKMMAASAANPEMGYDEMLEVVTKKDAAGKEVSFKMWVADAAICLIKKKFVPSAKAVAADNETWAEFVQDNGNGAQAPVAYTWAHYWVPVQWMQVAYLMPVSTAPPAKAVAVDIQSWAETLRETVAKAADNWMETDAKASVTKVVPTYAQAVKGKSSGGVAPPETSAAAFWASFADKSASTSVPETRAPAVAASAAVAATGPKGLLSMEMLGGNWADMVDKA